MNTLKDAFDKAYIKELIKIRNLYTRSGLFTLLRYRINFVIYMMSVPSLHDKGIHEARRILKKEKVRK